MIDRLVLFGATGDLAGRFLFPALASLFEAGRLSDGFSVTGSAREHLDEAAFRRRVDDALADHAGGLPTPVRQAFLRSLRYRSVDVADPVSVASLFTDHAAPTAAYLALPSSLFPIAVESLSAAGMPTGSRIVLEKPFGEDLQSAVLLNELLADAPVDEQAVFRVDHVLGMATSENLVALRRNRVLESVWNRTQIEQVDILWEETLALEGRAGYYDKAGALRDVLQNHMLQLLCLVAMELPANPDELPERKADVLRTVRQLPSAMVPFRSRRARYGAGRLAGIGGASGRPVPAYADEDGVDPARRTETFVELTLELVVDRWRDTPFVLRGGKALNRRRKGVLIHFGSSAGQSPNELWIGIDGPSDIVLRLSGGTSRGSTEVELRGEPPPGGLPAYARVLFDVLTGGSALSVTADEAVQSWRVVTPVLESWRANRAPLEEYPAGSEGPSR